MSAPRSAPNQLEIRSLPAEGKAAPAKTTSEINPFPINSVPLNVPDIFLCSASTILGGDE